MVREMRVPSSSSSSSEAIDTSISPTCAPDLTALSKGLRTNSDWLYPNSFLKMSVRGIVRILALKDSSAAEGVHEGGPTCTVALVDITKQPPAAVGPLRIPVPEAPQTIRQN